MSTGNTSLVEKNSSSKKRKAPPSYFKILDKNKESLKTCGFLLIHHTMQKVLMKTDILSVYMDEMLHSIFFLGHIHGNHGNRLTPKDFFSHTSLPIMSYLFPEPFIKYNSHLPTRTPFSILLHIMEILYSTEERIKEELQKLLGEMKFPNPLHKPGSKNEQYYTLESTVICVCSDSDSQEYYGASLCCRKGAAKDILIGLSCLKTWHEYVSHAVMSFTSGAPGDGDGITFPKSLRCQAFYRDWKENVYREKQACWNCKQLFNLQDADEDKVEHPFGNCAETECLSKLLINNQHVYENVAIDSHTQETLEELRSSTRARLITQLGEVGIKFTDDSFHFYKPCQEAPVFNVEDIKAVLNRILMYPAHG